jgi:hypothetical protein
MRTVAHLSCLVIAAALGTFEACGGTRESSFDRTSTASPEAGAPVDPFTSARTQVYMRQLAPWFVSRELESDELAALESGKFAAIRPMLTEWTKEPAFPSAARRLISQRLSVSGERDGIDFDLPGNLAEYVVRENLPLSTLLTADYCVDAKGSKRTCDSGAPFAAGVLATRAYLASRMSRFNLTRASTMMRTFSCRTYPIDDEVEPRLPRERLIPMFQSDAEVDDDGQAKATFGNGAACYECHGQFGAHAQLFVRFDETGTYRPDATGIQDPKGELGRSTDRLFASHLKATTEAKTEKSQMLGHVVNDLREAARVLAEDPGFVPCQAKNLLDYALRLPPSAEVDPLVLDEIAQQARSGGEATFASLVVETFAHPRVVTSVVSGLEGAP